MAVNYFTAGLASGLGQGANTMLQYEMTRKLAEKAMKQRLWAMEEERKAAARQPYEEAGIAPPDSMAASSLPEDPNRFKQGLSWLAGKMQGNERLAPIMEKIMPGMMAAPPEEAAAPPAGGPSPWEQLSAKQIEREKARQQALIPGQIELAKAGRNQQFIGVNPTQLEEWRRQDREEQRSQYNAAYAGFAKTAMNQDLTVEERMKKLAQDRLDTLRANPDAAASIDAAYGAAISAAHDPAYAYKPGILSNIYSSLTGGPGASDGGHAGPAPGLGLVYEQENPDYWETPNSPGYYQYIDPNFWGYALDGDFIERHNARLDKNRTLAPEMDVRQ